ncbi:14390_t:CDS:2 [Cetraspora pellucida]|uniref:14390_t:CDS:1 n=1 Tax=Cetraspora pellucida TaxID=1433469 RepID=A0ACA9LYI1_9GLOM|nr:14390_t:CDS:2 [Cetraspora pellucida]
MIKEVEKDRVVVEKVKKDKVVIEEIEEDGMVEGIVEKNQAKEYEKHKKQIEIKINDIITSHLSISITEIENLTTIKKLNIILNTIKQKIKEYLKLLDIPFQTDNSLMSMLKKLVKFCKNIEITSSV